ncbi:MAG: adenosine deaminase [bacterium]
MDLRAFIRHLPKAELHCHIEGTLEAPMMFDLAARNGVALPYASVEDARRAYRFENLQDFLDLYYQGMRALRTERDFYDLAYAYLQKAAAQSIRHVELFFDPQAHVARGVAFDAVVGGLLDALRAARRETGITSGLIMCFLRDRDPREAFDMLELAQSHGDAIIGVGLDSSERGNPPTKFTQVFAQARALGLRRVAHAGEEGPPEYIRDALDALQVERIDHGNSALDDDALMTRLADEAVPLTMCPLSNLKLRVIDSLSVHPLKTMLRRGLRVTVNSDDPAYFGGYLNENYVAVADALDLCRDDLIQLARNSIAASFVEPRRRDALLAEIDRYVIASH